MRAGDIFRLACRNLVQKPLRTLLCILSVAVGTGALALIASFGLFASAQVEAGLQTLGLSGLTVYLEERTAGNPLSAEMVEEMESALPQIENAMPIKAKTGIVRAGHATENAVFLGVSEKMGEVMQLEVVAGNLITAPQAAFGTPVCVVGDVLAQTVFGRDNITGRQLRLRIDGQDTYFTVCGVVKAQTGALGSALAAIAPHLVYIPYSFIASEQENADQVFVQCSASADPAETGVRLERYLTERRQVGGTVRVQNMSGMVETVRNLSQICTLLFVAAGGVTLCVALIGVLCSMLAATYEKTEEIGILLALGAQPTDIWLLFLLQSVLLCLLGGIAGLVMAGLLLWMVSSLLMPGCVFCLCLLLLSLLCGAVAGLLPAVRAARLDPIEAMRK